MLQHIQNLVRRDEDGASAVEYGLLVAGIAALIVAIVFIFGGVIKDTFSKTCGKVSSGVSGTYNSAATC
ncbi:Flp family type IVb pilin [Nocardioides marmorisolisilvae]|uniref:Flp family type IVb pilin n=2 Tax=Nocardioides marmorisolisilvae TaxID=1542737 RepID=A0A3N0DTZ3_9ACTN|nr:Flp family type IVb pilin [Nocardioides marmorisolisilvae]